MEKKNCYRILFTTPEKECPLGRLWYRREEHIKINLEGIKFECMEWIQLAQARVSYCALVSTIRERADDRQIIKKCCAPWSEFFMCYIRKLFRKYILFQFLGHFNLCFGLQHSQTRHLNIKQLTVCFPRGERGGSNSICAICPPVLFNQRNQ
jgi:hypothetical protein